MVRTNGFQPPLHPFQVVAWVFFLFFVVSFFTLFAIGLDDAWLQAVDIVYAIEAVALVVSTIRVTMAEPVDPDAKGWAVMPMSSYDINLRRHKEPPDSNHIWCPYCTVYVQVSSKHCRICDKCVYSFDHHCKWLNNCVGGENYRVFMVTISSVTGVLLTQAAVGLYIFIGCFDDDGPVPRHLHERYPSFNLTLYQVLVGVITLIILPLLVSIVQLLALHISFIYRNLTTYEWILQRRAKHKEEKKLKAQKLAEKQIEMEEKQKAETERKHRSPNDVKIDMVTSGKKQAFSATVAPNPLGTSCCQQASHSRNNSAQFAVSRTGPAPVFSGLNAVSGQDALANPDNSGSPPARRRTTKEVASLAMEEQLTAKAEPGTAEPLLDAQRTQSPNQTASPKNAPRAPGTGPAGSGSSLVSAHVVKKVAANPSEEHQSPQLQSQPQPQQQPQTQQQQQQQQKPQDKPQSPPSPQTSEQRQRQYEPTVDNDNDGSLQQQDDSPRPLAVDLLGSPSRDERIPSPTHARLPDVPESPMMSATPLPEPRKNGGAFVTRPADLLPQSEQGVMREIQANSQKTRIDMRIVLQHNAIYTG